MPATDREQTRVDLFFTAARADNLKAFIDWMGSVELPIRRSLERHARAVDVESSVQETFLRMWVLAQDNERELTGENASLRFAIGMARNLARAEARRTGREHLLPTGELPEIPIAPRPSSDPALRRAIRSCLEKLPKKPKAAIEARIDYGAAIPDGNIAKLLKMTRNTFLQNVVRARKLVAACLESGGIRLSEVLR
jgi:DNA-directed RNA polymerase specialized sigma24 family protein